MAPLQGFRNALEFTLFRGVFIPRPIGMAIETLQAGTFCFIHARKGPAIALTTAEVPFSAAV